MFFPRVLRNVSDARYGKLGVIFGTCAHKGGTSINSLFPVWPVVVNFVHIIFCNKSERLLKELKTLLGMYE